jgi:hypothetical protein
MTSEVDISNMALATLGEAPNVLTLSPPDSPNAKACALFLDQARTLTLAAQPWVFAAKRAVLASPRVAVSSFAAIGDLITTPVAHGFETNDPLMFALSSGVAGTAPGGLSFTTTYYAKPTSTTTLQLATEEDGDAVNITTSGTGSFVLERLSDRADQFYVYAEPTDLVFVGPDAVVPNGWDPHNGTAAIVRPFDEWGDRCYDRRPAYGKIPYERALNKAGERVIYTNLEDAELLYTAAVDDPTLWPPDALQCWVLQLALLLAGPVKRDDGKTYRMVLPMLELALSKAASSNAVQVQRSTQRSYGWDR